MVIESFVASLTEVTVIAKMVNNVVVSMSVSPALSTSFLGLWLVKYWRWAQVCKFTFSSLATMQATPDNSAKLSKVLVDCFS